MLGRKWRAYCLRFAVLCLFSASCEHDDGPIVPADTTRPTVTATSPPENATDVTSSVTVIAMFSEPVNPASVTTSTFTLRDGSTTLAAPVSLIGSTAILIPPGGLAYNTTYTAQLTTGITDLAGNSLATDRVWSFSTIRGDRTSPTVTATDPADGATNVATNAVVTATFSEPIAPASVTASTFLLSTDGVPVDCLVNASGSGVTLVPATALASAAKYTALLTTGVTDLAGNHLVTDRTWSFSTPVALNEPELIDQFRTAYQRRDYQTLRHLLHPGYRFFLNEPSPDGTTDWGLAEELRIHFRMFSPADIQPPDPPLPVELWLSAVDIALTARDVFQDAPSYYFHPVTNPMGFPRENFTVTQTEYVTSVFFETQGETDYRVDGAASFVVVNDLSKLPGEVGKFLIYRWGDLGSPASSAIESVSWSGFKLLYK